MGDRGEADRLLRPRHRALHALGHYTGRALAGHPAGRGRHGAQARADRRRPRAARGGVGQDAHLPRARVPGHGVSLRRARHADEAAAGVLTVPLGPQLINLMAALLLLIAFAMLSQRRIRTLIYLFAWQGLVLSANSVVVAYSTGQSHLYFSAAITLGLKVVALPLILLWLIRRLNVQWDVETLINIPTTMLVGILLVVFAFNLALPITQLAGTITRSTLGIAIAIVLLSFLMMLTRRKAVPQVIGF